MQSAGHSFGNFAEMTWRDLCLRCSCSWRLPTRQLGRVEARPRGGDARAGVPQSIMHHRVASQCRCGLAHRAVCPAVGALHPVRSGIKRPWTITRTKTEVVAHSMCEMARRRTERTINGGTAWGVALDCLPGGEDGSCADRVTGRASEVSAPVRDCRPSPQARPDWPAPRPTAD